MLETFHKNWKKATEMHLQLYVTHLHTNVHLKASTIKSHLSAISFYQQYHFNKNFTDSFAIKKLLKYYTKLDGKTGIRHPITQNVLEKIVLNLTNANMDDYYKHAFLCMYNMMFLMALRVSEIADYSDCFSHAIKFNDIFISRKHVRIILRTCKHNSEPTTFCIQDQNFKKLLTNWLKIRGTKQGCLFIHSNGIKFSRLFIYNQLKSDIEQIGLNPASFNTHSFRKGRATSLALQGFSTKKIAAIGRWKSNAYKKYIDPSIIHI